MCVCVFKRNIKEGLTEKLMFENNLKERNKGGSCADIWGKSIPGGGNSQCKGPEAGACLLCAKNSEEVSGWSRVDKKEMVDVR